jgi:hypothetical protein
MTLKLGIELASTAIWPAFAQGCKVRVNSEVWVYEARAKEPPLSNDILAKIVVTAVVTIAFAFWMSFDKSHTAHQALFSTDLSASHR